MQFGGGAYTGQFDISSYLSSGPDSYEVVGATVVATGFSAQDDHLLVGAYGAPQFVSGQTYVVTPAHFETVMVQQCSFFICIDVPTQVFVPEVTATNQTYTQQRDINHTDLVQDAMLLDVGEATGAGSVTTHQFTVSPYVIDGILQQTGSFATGTTTYLGQTRTITDWRFGPLSSTAALTLNDLAGLNSSGLLDFSVAATAGRFNLTNVALQFDLRAIGGGVPEPATWGMLIMGFAGLGLTLRRRRGRLAAA